MTLLKRKKKPTKAELNKKTQRKRELKIMMYGGLCGLILAITPVLALTLTPAYLTQYLTGQILFSSSSGGGSTSSFSNLIDRRINSVTSAPLSLLNNKEHENLASTLFLQKQYLNTNTTWTAGGIMKDLQARIITNYNRTTEIINNQAAVVFPLTTNGYNLTTNTPQTVAEVVFEVKNAGNLRNLIISINPTTPNRGVGAKISINQAKIIDPQTGAEFYPSFSSSTPNPTNDGEFWMFTNQSYQTIFFERGDQFTLFLTGTVAGSLGQKINLSAEFLQQVPANTSPALWEITIQ